MIVFWSIVLFEVRDKNCFGSVVCDFGYKWLFELLVNIIGFICNIFDGGFYVYVLLILYLMFSI